MLVQQIHIDGFHYQAADKQIPMSDKTVKTMKVLSFQDKNNTNVAFNFIFSPEQFKDFLKNISDKKIIKANAIPKNIIQFPK